MARNYVILDVFTDKALSGNPLAVVLDSEGLSDERMLQIAGEFNLSETVFVCPPTNPLHTASLRIFTPIFEMPFAGHPTIGSAALLASERFGEISSPQDAVIVLEEKVGIIRCGVKLNTGGISYAEFDVPSLAKPAMSLGSNELIAAALGIELNEIGFENHRPCTMDAGVPFAFIPVRDLTVVEQLKPNANYWNEAFGSHDHNNAFIYCRETVNSQSDFHARMIHTDSGSFAEDAATGSAAAAFAGTIARFDEPLDGTHRFTVEQGLEMGRPSIIDLEIDMEKGQIRAQRIGGNAVIVGRGQLYI
ncbi:PhzF family phenazine biosynthesis protein [Flexibacterium corallicola]|uniref:PhzF family phenazine biosynthesis protein n=1 Tax=Flexibacterium corallicola TaxID=3037259 RepID=UPI00286ECC2B|nr:PhzF family phenazine biosynthesis protein [Pseudovibrio sp. M1P-2-3]